MTYQVDILKVTAFLKIIIQKRVNIIELNWINQQEKILKNNFQSRSFYLAFSSAPRFISKKILFLTDEELSEADLLRKGFQPERWSLLQCVRTYFLLLLPVEDAENFEATMTKLFETADMEEQVTLYAALPLLPYPDFLTKRATEGLRTNITDVFDAIALHNPFPIDYLNEDAWNQMILKAVFMQRPLYRIYGGDKRANPELARMLVDFAHERWAANRQVSPELWRFVGPFLNKNYLTDIEKVIKGNSLQIEAGLMACTSSKQAKGEQILNQFPDIKKDIENGRLNWNMIGIKNENNLET
jgi:hypothetical protein